MGPKAVAAVSALIHALGDSEAYVRAPVADAIGSIGPMAKAAVQPLTERLLTGGEQVYVLRSVASALGNIGPDAASALPALQQALRMHRVTYTAQEAILKIKKEPVPTWF
jgi:HEAT repeat protein